MESNKIHTGKEIIYSNSVLMATLRRETYIIVYFFAQRSEGEGKYCTCGLYISMIQKRLRRDFIIIIVDGSITNIYRRSWDCVS